MKSTKLVISVLAGILVLSAIVMVVENSDATTAKALTSHAPIQIHNNSDFATQASDEGWTGNGTAGNPYIIENYEIDASSADGIEIRNTNAYFVIRVCVVHEGKGNYNGIYFSNVTNGKINNVTSYHNECGVSLRFFSNNNKITNCNVYNNDYDGIVLGWDSSNNNITNCKVYNNGCGIGVGSSSNNKITSCDVYRNGYGIYLYNSDNNKITNCTVYNNGHGILVRESLNNEVHYSDIYNNREYGVYNYHTASQYEVNATYNWCGSANGPRGIGHGSGDKVSANVLYDPWLIEPFGEEAPKKSPEEAPLPYWALYLSIAAIIILAVSFGVIVKKRKKLKE